MLQAGFGHARHGPITSPLKCSKVALIAIAQSVFPMIDEGNELETIRQLAVERGATEARIIEANQVVVADWVFWKCRFGCPNYNKTFTCPPHSPSPQQTRELLKGYRYALLLRYDLSRNHHQLLLDLEREAFLKGFYKAWGLTSGPCDLCEKCDLQQGKCLNPESARPSMEACGIDVFATARNAGLTMKVLTSNKDEYYRTALLLIT